MSPDIDILELTGKSARFVMKDVTPSFANALRRALISDVPKMAINEVEFHLGSIRDEEGREYESVTPLFDEIIAHRLGLVPIPTEPELFEFREECVCEGEGCPNCTLLYTLNKKGPSDKDTESVTVYSDELQLVKQSVEGFDPKEYEEKFAITEKIPIVKLNRNQAMLLYARAELGYGSEDAKWQATHGVGYKYYPSVEIDSVKCDLGTSCVKLCPTNVLAVEGKKIVVADLEACTMCKACVDVCEMKAIKVTGDENKLIFRLETDGGLTPKEALCQAMEVLEAEFAWFEETFAEAFKAK